MKVFNSRPYIIFVLFIFVSFLFWGKQNAVFSQEAINELKDRIASRVAQLKLVERRGIVGTVTEASNTQITVSDIQNNTRLVDVDELTKFSSPSAKGSFGISDIAKGSKVGVLGLYNKESRRTLARFVNVLVTADVFHGAVAYIDKENFAVTVAVRDKKQIVVDVENTTRTYLYKKDSDLTRSGFSKINIGERIMVVGFKDLEQANKVVASRIILFPEIPPNPLISASPITPSVNPTQSP